MMNLNHSNLPVKSVMLTTFLVSMVGTSEAQDRMPKKLVYIMDTVTSKADVLMQADSEYDRQGSAVWSPDGKRIGFDSFRSLTGETWRECHVFLTDIKGKEWTDLGDGAMPSFSHDASKICFSRYSPNSGVWLMNADGSGKECIDPRGWSPRWSPDGK